MSANASKEVIPWGLSTEKFFYFYMGLRKGEVRRHVQLMRDRYPQDSTERLARRLVSAQAPLSLLGAGLMHLPALVPSIGPVLRALGVAAGTSAMVQLHMVLLLEIAFVYGHDINDRARVKEMLAIIAATGLASGTSLLPYTLNLTPRYGTLFGGATDITVSHLIGEAAIRYYRRPPAAEDSLEAA